MKLNIHLSKVPLASPPVVQYATSKSAAFDFCADIGVDWVLLSGEVAKIPTGCFIEEAADNECLLVLPRSGLAAKYAITVCNSPGLIDSDFRQEIQVLLINHGKSPFTVHPGDRIAQGLLLNFESVNNIFRPDTVRAGGFGHSGV